MKVNVRRFKNRPQQTPRIGRHREAHLLGLGVCPEQAVIELMQSPLKLSLFWEQLGDGARAENRARGAVPSHAPERVSRGFLGSIKSILDPPRSCLRALDRLHVGATMRRDAPEKKTAAIEPAAHPKWATTYDARVVLDAGRDRDDRS
jgi:hypothetical protein